MPITRTYAVGQNNTVRRLDNHTGPWIDVSIPFLPGAGGMDCLDVMADPNNPDNVVVVGNFFGPGTGIVVSNDAGVTWNQPGGDWKQAKVFYEVWWVNSNDIWIVGDTGHVVRSTDGGATFNLTGSRCLLPTGGSYNFTSCIHAISDQVAVVAGVSSFNATAQDLLVWKTINGGASWTILNAGAFLANTLPTGSPAGAPEGIWISDDEQEIIVGTTYQQFLTTNGGFGLGDFSSQATEFTRSGRHLTWFPSYGAPTNFRHVGGPILNINESINTGVTWDITRSNEGIVIRGAHFYSEFNGYYIVGREVFYTNTAGLSGTLSDTAPGVDAMNAVWTSTSSPLYCLTNCEDPTVVIYTDDVTLIAYLGSVIQATIVDPSPIGWPPDTCWIVSECDTPNDVQLLTSIIVDASFADCDECTTPPIDDSECYDLISCNGECTDILGAQVPFSISPGPGPGSLWFINGDSNCIYEIYPLRQAFFAITDYSIFSNPAGDFQLGSDDHTFEVTSLILDSTEYITSPTISYIMNPGNYNPVDVIGNNPAIPVAPNTTENSWSNLADYLNSVFAIFNLPLEAYPADPAACNIDVGFPLSWFKVQYRDGSTFSISFTITNNAGVTPVTIQVIAGNISIELGYPVSQTDLETCNSNVRCTPRLQPQIDIVEAWLSECPTPPQIQQPELGEACDVTPSVIRLGEPGFSWKNCDPNRVISVKNKFAESVYALFTRMRYGIQTCCEFDLDQIDVMNQLLDLGKLYDPDLCVDGRPLPVDCCPQPCDATARVIVPLWLACPAPTNAIIGIDVPPPVQACIPPSGVDGGTDSASAWITIG